jgi:adenylyltransferase/sulfurtransferase
VVLALREVNSACPVRAIPRRLQDDELLQEVSKADAILDCSDNFATRHAINRACVRYRKPLVSGAGIRFDGQISSFDLRRADSPCYHCLFPESDSGEEERCAIMGVFAPLVGIIGAMQASEAIRILTGVGEPLTGRLAILDGLNQTWHQVKLMRDPECAVCGSAHILERSIDHAHV